MQSARATNWQCSCSSNICSIIMSCKSWAISPSSFPNKLPSFVDQTCIMDNAHSDSILQRQLICYRNHVTTNKACSNSAVKRYDRSTPPQSSKFSSSGPYIVNLGPETGSEYQCAAEHCAVRSARGWVLHRHPCLSPGPGTDRITLNWTRMHSSLWRSRGRLITKCNGK